jgi:hypothetical protein
MADTIEVPVESVTALETHEIVDAAQHAKIAQTEDEDYKWLTERLDAHQAEMAALRGQVTALETLLQSNQEQSRTLIAAQSEMITQLLASVTSLSESALLRSNLSNLESSSPVVVEAPPETVVEAVTEAVPEESVPTAESSEVGALAKKRRRM